MNKRTSEDYNQKAEGGNNTGGDMSEGILSLLLGFVACPEKMEAKSWPVLKRGFWST